jgi:hypothetical protein
LIAVVDGRHSLIKEVQAAPNDLRLYLIEAMRVLLDEPLFWTPCPAISCQIAPASLASRCSCRNYRN